MTKNYKKIQLKKNFFFVSKTTIYLSLGLHKERPTERTEKAFSSQKRHPTLKNMSFKQKFLLDPDPDSDSTRLNPDLIRIQIRIRIRNPAVAQGLVPGHELVIVNSDEGLGAGPRAPGLSQSHSLPRSELRL
jgi:hypothetical protein